MASIYTAGSASVQIVPDFTNAQRKIGQWFAGQDDIKVQVQPDIDQAALARTQAQLAAGVQDQTSKVKVDVDRAVLARNFVAALDNLAGFGTIQKALLRIFDPSTVLKTSLGGSAVALAASVTQAVGSAALLPGIISAATLPIGTLVVGMQGLGEAFSALASGDAEKVAAAMKNLSFEAQQFAFATRGLAGAWKELRFDVQNELFDGLSIKMRELGQKGIPVLREGMSGIAEEINNAAESIFDLLSSDANLADFGHTMDNIKTIVKELGGAAPALLKAFFDIATVGSDFLAPMAGSLRESAEEFRDFIQSARDSGELADFIGGAVAAFSELWQVVKNLAGIIGEVFSAALPAGTVLMGILKEVTGDLRDFLSTDVAQSSLSTFFDQIVDAVDALQPAFAAITEALVTGVLPAMSGFAQALAPVVGEWLTLFAEMVAEIAPLVYPALAGAIAALVSAMSPLIEQFGEAVMIVLPPFIELIDRMAPSIAKLTSSVADGLLGAMQALAPLFPPLVDALVAIGAELVNFIDIVLDLAVAVMPPFVAILQALAVVLEYIAPILPVVATALIGMKVASVVATGLTAMSGALLNMAVGAERLGAAKLSDRLLGAARGAERASGLLAGLSRLMLGPLGIALAVGTAAFAVYRHEQEELSEATRELTEDLLVLRKQEAVGGVLGDKARQEITDYRDRINELKIAIAELESAPETGKGASAKKGRLEDLRNELEMLQNALRGSQQDYSDYLAQVGPVQVATDELALATAAYYEALEKGTPAEAAAALEQLRIAEANVADETERANNAKKTQIELMQEQRDAILGAANAQIAYERAQLDATDAISEYNEALASGTLSADDRARAELGVRDQLLSAADAAAVKAAADNAGKTDTEIAKAASDAYLETLKTLAGQLGENVPAAISELIASLEASASEADWTKGQMEELGISVLEIPNSKTIKIDAPTAEQKERLEKLGYQITTLPNGDVYIYLRDEDAKAKMNDFVNQKRSVGVTVYWTSAGDLKVPGGKLLQAHGGIVAKAFAGGGFMPGSMAQIVPPNTWRIIGDRVRDDEAFIPINDDARSREILAETASRMGFALASASEAWAPPGLSSLPTGDALSGSTRFKRVGGTAGMPTTVAGFVNNGTVLTTDLGELSRQAKQGTQRAMVAAGLR